MKNRKKSNLPLSGIRVIDSTNSWAGPFTTQIMANWGAQVIKVESIQYMDTWRASGNLGDNRDAYWERSPLWNSVNTDKLGITLNLNDDRAKKIFLELVKISDIVAENFTPRVMKNFGLDYPALKAVNPGIIMISLPAHGSTGPWKDTGGYAASIEQTAGIPMLTGFPEGLPKMSSAGFTDPIAGINGASAVLMALLHRQKTGKGQYIDLSQVEATTSLIGDAIVEYAMNGIVPSRRGNRHPFAAPHGYYRCQGVDKWLGLAIYNDDEWKKLCRIMGKPGLTRESKYISIESRWQHQDEIDPIISAWTCQHDHYTAMHRLQKAGITAGAVLNPEELLSDPHLTFRNSYYRIDHAVMGEHLYQVPTSAMRLSGISPGITLPAPLLGEHNAYVLGEILNIPAADIKQLEEDQVIGSRPQGM